MNQPTTMREVHIQFQEEFVKAKTREFLRMHPSAKIKILKKKIVIEIPMDSLYYDELNKSIEHYMSKIAK